MTEKSHFVRLVALVLLGCFLPVVASASNKSESFTVDGLRYATELYGQRVALTGCDDPEMETLVVPDVVVRESDGKEYTVVRIGASIDNLDENIWSANWAGHHFCEMPNLRKVDLSQAVHLEKIGYHLKRGLSGKTYYRVSYAFCDNPNLTEIIFPQAGNLREIICSFSNVPVTDLDLPEGLANIRGNAFKDCSSLKNVRLPSTTTEVESALTLPPSMTVTLEYPFEDTNLDNLVILSENVELESKNQHIQKTFRPYPEYHGATNSSNHGTNADSQFLLLDRNTAVQPVLNVFRWDFQSYAVPFAEHAPNPYVIDITHSSDSDGKCSYEVSEYGDRYMSFSTSERDTPLNVKVQALSLYYSPNDFYYGLETSRTRRRNAPLTLVSKADDSFDKSTLTVVIRQTNQTLTVQDESADEFRGRYNFTVEGLRPKTEYTAGLYFGDKHLGDRAFKTKGLSPSFKQTACDVTTFEGVGSYNFEGDEGDVLEEEYISFNGSKYPGKEISLTGLAPATEYKASYCVKLADMSLETKAFTIKTAGPLELTTVAPKVVSSSAAIVGAESNLSEKETHAGLEWRKIDAPEEIPSKRADIIPIDGSMEGRIENLDASVYYKVRAFYETYDGSKQWYGEWIGFDPSDFSYFVPTVRTFETVTVETNSADVKGYVLAGTDVILSQGFEYWVVSPESSGAPKLRALANESYSTVLANGQVMTATLPELRPDTEYAFRSFATTPNETTYGEERTFRTKVNLSFIDEIGGEEVADVAVEGYYDLRGVRHDEAVRGFNIVRYTDGTVRKILVK